MTVQWFLRQSPRVNLSNMYNLHKQLKHQEYLVGKDTVCINVTAQNGSSCITSAAAERSKSIKNADSGAGKGQRNLENI